MELEEALGKLTDRMQIKREHGVSLLQSVLTNADRARRQELRCVAVERVKELINAGQWESRHGGFCAAKVLLLSQEQKMLSDELLPLALLHLEDPEPGVRLAVGECFYALGKAQGSAVYFAVKEEVPRRDPWNMERFCGRGLVSARLLQSIDNGFDGEKFIGESLGPGGAKILMEDELDLEQRLHQVLVKRGRFLETSVRALQRVMEGCGDSFQPHVTPQLWELLLKALPHKNRFVRETGFLCVNSLCHASPVEVLKGNGALIATCLALGLADNWSQVRYAASIATRTFMQRTHEFKSEYYSILLPAMCLNRYYGAEGLRLYSQETWQLLMGSTGKDEVAKCVDHVLDYYISQSSAENHLVREATCHCIAELLGKIEAEKIGLLVPRMVDSLITCLKDSNWAVRDAACSAMGKAITGYPEEVRIYLTQLYDLWFAHLADNVRSVRENSAFTLGSAMRTYQGEAIEKVVLSLQELLPMAKKQVDKWIGGYCYGPHHSSHCRDADYKGNETGAPANSQSNITGDSGVLAGVNEACIDRGFARKSEPWEQSEGGIYLLRELSAVAPDRAQKFLPVLVELAQSSEVAHYHSLMETLYRLLPFIAQNLGKRNFKPYLELFIDPLFTALSCGQRLSENASGYCVSKLIVFIGPNIFKARLNSSQLAILHSSPLITTQVQ